MRTRALVTFVSTVGLALLLSWAVRAQGMSAIANSTTYRVSLSSGGAQGNDDAERVTISANGRYTVFASDADNLVNDDTNAVKDVFVHDRQTGQTSRASVASGGVQANGASYALYGTSISADGRFVTFASYADNLVSGDTNAMEDIFVHDLQTGQTSRVSIASDGSQGNGQSSGPAISADGRYVAFYSEADNLVSNDTNDSFDIFVHDRQTGQTSRASVASNGVQGNMSSQLVSISEDGRYVAFFSNAGNLVSGDDNYEADIFVRDRQAGQTSRVSVASDGTQANGLSWASSISADGRFVAFESEADNLVSGDTNAAQDIFVHDRQTGQTARVSVASDGAQANGISSWPSISADGRYIAFESQASNLVSGDTNATVDIFVHDQATGQTTRVSVAWDGRQATSLSASGTASSLSGDGRYAAFYSYASNLVSGDTNHVGDAFVRDRAQGEAVARAVIPLSGGTLTSWPYDTTLVFASDTFTATALVTYTGYFPIRHSPPISMADIGHAFDLTGIYTDTGLPARPTRPYTIAVQYIDDESRDAIENTLALYYWDGSAWVKEPSSVLDMGNNVLTATPDHFSAWAVLGEIPRTTFLPVILKSAR
jgi:hypothetical protein